MYDPAMRMPIRLPPVDGRPFDAVGFGLNMTDLLVVLERFPEPDSKQPVRRQAYSPGGQAASAMVACARLGWRARYVGCFGDDENGRQGRSSLADEGVDISACRVASDTRNGMSVILVDERTGERTVLWSRDPGLKQRPETIDARPLCAPAACCWSTATTPPPQTAAARHARRAGVRTVIDVERVRDGIDALLPEIDMISHGSGLPGRPDRHGHTRRRAAGDPRRLPPGPGLHDARRGGKPGPGRRRRDQDARVPRASGRYHRRRRRLPRRVHLRVAARRRRRGKSRTCCATRTR